MSVEWSDDAIVLGARPHGETHALAELFTRSHGRAAGIVHGGASRRMKPVLQAGNMVAATWKARTADQLGYFAPLELSEPFAARALEDSTALLGLMSAIALVRAGAVERQPYPAIFEALALFLDGLGEPELWPAIYARYEIGVLAALGYGLDLSVCAVTGRADDLAWVSPKTGRAACREAGEPYADKLLRLPPFLCDGGAPVETGDVADALALAGWFLEQRLFDRQGQGMPDGRRRLIEALGHAGRL